MQMLRLTYQITLCQTSLTGHLASDTDPSIIKTPPAMTVCIWLAARTPSVVKASAAIAMPLH